VSRWFFPFNSGFKSLQFLADKESRAKSGFAGLAGCKMAVQLYEIQGFSAEELRGNKSFL